MSETDDDLTKVTFKVPSKFYADIKHHVPWGQRHHLFIAVLGLVMRAIRDRGPAMMYAIMTDAYELVPRKPEGTDDASTNAPDKAA